MDLTVDYIRERHRYWRYKIADEGIWDVIKFEPVEFEVRPRSKTYNALFQRKIVKRKPVDKIIIYRKIPDMPVKFVDNLIVHEMIHQYIFQNNLYDSSTHGFLFRHYMQRINEAFKGELDIAIKSEAPKLKGPGDTTYMLMVVKMPDEYLFCNIRPGKMKFFEDYAKQENLKYLWGKTNDMFFDRVPRCTKVLQGYAVNPDDMEAFVKEHRIILLNRHNLP